jgi:hypothetical protein
MSKSALIRSDLELIPHRRSFISLTLTMHHPRQSISAADLGVAIAVEVHNVTMLEIAEVTQA